MFRKVREFNVGMLKDKEWLGNASSNKKIGMIQMMPN